MKKWIFCIFSLLVILLILLFVFTKFDFLKKSDSNQQIEASNSDSNLDNSQTFEKNGNLDTSTTITMTAIGDVMCHNTQYWDAYQKETDSYDFSYVFEQIADYIKNNDISIANLETSFAGKDRGYSNYPTFNSPDELVYNLKDIGLDIMTTAGNHCLDMGFSGLSRTIDVLDTAGIAHLGTFKTQEDRDKVFIQEVKGIKIAFVDYTYGTNGIPLPKDKEFCVNLIDKDLIKKDIENAKKQNPDIVVACMHWGTEYKTTANAEQEELADFLFKNGVDIILGNHPHCLEQMEKRTITLDDGTTKDGFVIYALGNFICDQNAENTRNGNGKISIDKANYIPIYMYKGGTSKLRRMRVLDIEKTITNYENGTDKSIGQATYNDLKVQLEKIQKIVGKEF